MHTPPPNTSTPAAAPFSRRVKVVTSVITLALLVAAVALVRSKPQTFKLITPAAIYNLQQNSGFTPTTASTTEKDFASLVERTLGTPLFIPATTPGVNVLGWADSQKIAGPSLGPPTLILLTKVDQENVLVLLNQDKPDRGIKVPPESGLHVFTRQIGNIVMYEITPLTTPRVIDAMRSGQP